MTANSATMAFGPSPCRFGGWLLMLAILGIIGFVVSQVYVQQPTYSQVIIIENGKDHADSKHVEAPLIRLRYRSGLCEGTELWFSPRKGTLMILCGLSESDGFEAGMWGALVYRVTENNASVFLTEEAYECTVMAAPRDYWDRSIDEGGYLPLANFPKVAAWLFATFGV